MFNKAIKVENHNLNVLSRETGSHARPDGAEIRTDLHSQENQPHDDQKALQRNRVPSFSGVPKHEKLQSRNQKAGKQHVRQVARKNPEGQPTAKRATFVSRAKQGISIHQKRKAQIPQERSRNPQGKGPQQVHLQAQAQSQKQAFAQRTRGLVPLARRQKLETGQTAKRKTGGKAARAETRRKGNRATAESSESAQPQKLEKGQETRGELEPNRTVSAEGRV